MNNAKQMLKKMSDNVRKQTEKNLHLLSDYKLANELQTRIAADIVGHENGRGCLSAEYIAKLNALNDAINAVKVHW
jgi:hypothetical protein